MQTSYQVIQSVQWIYKCMCYIQFTISTSSQTRGWNLLEDVEAKHYDSIN